MNSLLTPEMSDNCVEVLANSLLLAANSALFSNISGITCFVQIQSELPEAVIARQTVVLMSRVLYRNRCGCLV